MFLLQHIEALLYGFQSIAETIDVNYSDVIPGLIGLIPRISINNVQLADTVMFTIGEVPPPDALVTGVEPRRLTCFSPHRRSGRVAGRPPGDAQQRPSSGAAGAREPGPVGVFCLHPQEDMQGV